MIFQLSPSDFPLQATTIPKPRMRPLSWGRWRCEDINGGPSYAATPQAAYEGWRKEVLRRCRALNLFPDRTL